MGQTQVRAGRKDESTRETSSKSGTTMLPACTLEPTVAPAESTSSTGTAHSRIMPVWWNLRKDTEHRDWGKQVEEGEASPKGAGLARSAQRAEERQWCSRSR